MNLVSAFTGWNTGNKLRFGAAELGRYFHAGGIGAGTGDGRPNCSP